MAYEVPENKLPEETKVCNCAGCGRLLLAASFRWWRQKHPPDLRQTLPPVIAGRRKQRPYCRRCLADLNDAAQKAVA